MSTTPNDDFTQQQEGIIVSAEKFEQLYDKDTKSFANIAFIINGGAAIALATFFSNCHSPNNLISFATCSFILGVVFGIFLFIIEFFISYSQVATFRKHVFDHSINNNYLLNMIKHHQEYLENYYQKKSTLANIKIITGIISIICCFIGIFFIAVFITKKWRLISISTAILLLLILGTLIRIYNMLKPSSGDEKA